MSSRTIENRWSCDHKAMLKKQATEVPHENKSNWLSMKLRDWMGLFCQQQNSTQCQKAMLKQQVNELWRRAMVSYLIYENLILIYTLFHSYFMMTTMPCSNSELLKAHTRAIFIDEILFEKGFESSLSRGNQLSSWYMSST